MKEKEFKFDIYASAIQLREHKPVIVIDTREQNPLSFKRFASVRGTLTTGDYSFVGGENFFAIEKKSLDDFVSCVTKERERFERELLRLRGYEFARVVVIASKKEILLHSYRSRVTPLAIWSSIYTWEIRYRVPFVLCATAEEASEKIENWVWWMCHEFCKRVNILTSAYVTKTKKEVHNESTNSNTSNSTV
jgi:ERCC4-type nuclease